MSQDHIQRQIDVIVENQARFSEGMLMLKDALVSLTHIVEEMAGSDAKLSCTKWGTSIIFSSIHDR